MAILPIVRLGHPALRGVARGLSKYVGRTAGTLFAIALIDASIIGAAAVGLSRGLPGLLAPELQRWAPIRSVRIRAVSAGVPASSENGP